MLRQNALKEFDRQIALPNPNNRVSEFSQVGVPRCILSTLANLAETERFKFWMAMPPIAISFNDEVTNPEVYDEIWLDKERRLIADTHFYQHCAQFSLKTRWSGAVKFSTSYDEALCNCLTLRCRFSPCRYFPDHFWPMHWIVRLHVSSGGAVDKASSSLSGQANMQGVGLSYDLNRCFVERLCHKTRAVMRISLSEISNLSVGPD
jgi:hypothetical protein